METVEHYRERHNITYQPAPFHPEYCRYGKTLARSKADEAAARIETAATSTVDEQGIFTVLVLLVQFTDHQDQCCLKSITKSFAMVRGLPPPIQW
jgi:hypothetical protein